ncbi:unnamed protein product [[Candida] boidinii]|nr:unnamed protein product [[Candida] boidinii]
MLKLRSSCSNSKISESVTDATTTTTTTPSTAASKKESKKEAKKEKDAIVKKEKEIKKERDAAIKKDKSTKESTVARISRIDPSKPFNEDDYKNINLYPGALLPPSKISPQNKKSIKFTSVEDEVILELIRRNPHLRATHSFFTQIATLPSLSGHTGNSVRFRFRKVITPTLDFVYDVDPKTNELKLDPETKEPVKIQELPELIKSQYTAEEDYVLCSKILNFKQSVSGITPTVAATASSSTSSKVESKESDESKKDEAKSDETKSDETSNGDATTTESSKDSTDAATAAAAAAASITSALKATATIPSN